MVRDKKETKCRAGCTLTETTAHGGRILRHNIRQTLANNLTTLKYTVIEEPHLRTSHGLRKPDIITVKDRKEVIIDTQIISGATSLSHAHYEKRNKHGRDKEVQQMVADLLNTEVTNIFTTTCTLSWRGVWAQEFRTDLSPSTDPF